MNPKYSSISVGENNRYNHPKKSVLNTLSNSKIYRTDKDGSIEIKIKSAWYSIETCSSQEGELKMNEIKEYTEKMFEDIF